MRTRIISHLLGATAIGLAWTGAEAQATEAPPPSTASAADAQSAAPAPGAGTAAQPAGLEEIVVTAQKRAENLQTVPIAVSAVTGAKISEIHATSLRELQGSFPGIQLGSFANNKQSAVISIRGIGVLEADPYAGNTVSVVVDGIPQYFNYGALLNLYDVERVEVLRGPQGTLFGANTTGGVVNVVTAQPTGEFGGSAEATYGNHNRVDFGGALNAPVTDTLSAKLTVFHHGEDGWIKNVADRDQPLGKEDQTILRGYLKYSNHANFDATLIAGYDRIRDGGGYIVNGASPGDPNSQPAILAPESLYQTPGVNGMYPSVCPADTSKHCSAPHSFVSGRSADSPDISNLNIYRLTYTMNLRNTPIGDITAITGYKHFNFLEFVDQDGGPADIESSRRYSDGWQLSQEVRTAAKLTDRLNIQFGGFYLRDFYRQDQEVYYNFVAPGFDQITPHQQKNYSLSGFGQAYYNLTDQLQFVAGIRYTHEYTKLTTQVENWFAPNTTAYYGGGKGLDVLPPAGSIDVGGDIAPITGKKSWNNVGWKLGVNFKPVAGTLIYASWSRGFKSGGFTGRIGFPSDIGPYKPEHVDTYEGGLKTDLLDRHLRANLALFYTDYRDMQLSQTYSFQDPATGNQVNSSSILNASSAHIKGAEAEVTALPFTGLTIGGSLTYLDAKYSKFDYTLPQTAIVLDLKGARLQNAPKWTANANVNYEFAVGEGKATARADYSYTSSKYQNIELPARGYIQPMSLIGASLDWQPGGGQWSVEIWGRNLANKHYFSSVYQSYGYGAFAEYLRPREFGGTVRVKW